MEPIDGLDKLMRLLRSRASEKTTRTERQAAATPGAGSERAQVMARPTIEQELRTRIRQLRSASANQHAIDQAVIGTMLAWEFSDELYNESKFNALAQRVYRHIENEPRIQAALHKIIEQLDT
jgi:hypothetical protein